MPTHQVIFHGKVQGVGFRWTTLQFAAELPIKGYVRNLSDGTVELVASCHSEHLEQLLAKLKQNFGPGILAVNVSHQPTVVDYDDFRIRH